MTPLERINMAIHRIQTVGWTTGHLRQGYSGGGPGCLLGSLITDEEYHERRKVLHLDDGELMIPGDLYETIKALGFKRIVTLTAWNDNGGLGEDAPFDAYMDVIFYPTKARDRILARLIETRDRLIAEQQAKEQAAVQAIIQEATNVREKQRELVSA